jgi:predicted nucleic acid-binding protein
VILADTSVWVDYIRDGDPDLTSLLNQEMILIHPFVVGELAVGKLRNRDAILRDLQELPLTVTAADFEVLRFISRYRLYGLGIGYVDCHLLASVMLTPDALLWTHDKRLSAVAGRLGVAAILSRQTNGPK